METGYIDNLIRKVYNIVGYCHNDICILIFFKENEL